MWFKVHRTSDSIVNANRPPCPFANFVQVGEHDFQNYWQISFNNLESLLTFVSGMNNVIISKVDQLGTNNGEPEFELEIYDDYRE